MAIMPSPSATSPPPWRSEAFASAGARREWRRCPGSLPSVPVAGVPPAYISPLPLAAQANGLVWPPCVNDEPGVVLNVLQAQHRSYNHPKWYRRYYDYLQLTGKETNAESVSYLHKVTQLMNSGARIHIYDADSTAWFFPRIPCANRQASKWLLYLLPCSNHGLFLIISTFWQFHFPPSAQVLWEEKQAPSALVTSIKNKDSKGTSLGVLCICWWAGATHISGGGS